MAELTRNFGAVAIWSQYRNPQIGQRSGRLRVRSFLKLLGIHWGQFPEMWELRDRDSVPESRKKHLIVDGSYVKGMSGMTTVIPAWQILELLEMPELKGPRDIRFSEASSDEKFFEAKD